VFFRKTHKLGVHEALHKCLYILYMDPNLFPKASKLATSLQITTVDANSFIGCVTDDRQTHGATRTCLTNTLRDGELILDFEVILQLRSRLISLFH